MKKTFRIGTKEFQSKKEAINHYRKILNFYKCGQSLNESDFEDVCDLLDYSKYYEFDTLMYIYIILDYHLFFKDYFLCNQNFTETPAFKNPL